MTESCLSKNQKSIRTIGVYVLTRHLTSRFHARLNLFTVAGRDSFLFLSVHTESFRKNSNAILVSQLHWNLIRNAYYLLLK